jgi:hypothetical protein
MPITSIILMITTGLFSVHKINFRIFEVRVDRVQLAEATDNEEGGEIGVYDSLHGEFCELIQDILNKIYECC